MLLLTLVLLALVAVLLLGLSRRSVARATEARDAAVDLQRRWGATTVRAALLPRADRLLDAVNEARATRREPVTNSFRDHVELGGQVFDFIVSDEQAKANLNVALARLSDERAANVIGDLVPSKLAAIDVALRADPRAALPPSPSPPPPAPAPEGGQQQTQQPPPTPEDGAQEVSPSARLVSDPPAFGAWGQVFPSAGPPALLGFTRDEAGLTSQITLWGDGRLNLRRATPEALTAVAGRLLNAAQVRRIIDARDASPGASAEEWIAAAAVADEQRPPLQRLMTDESSVFAVAVAVEDDWRLHYAVTVRESTAPARPTNADVPADNESDAAPQPEEAADATPVTPDKPEFREHRLAW